MAWLDRGWGVPTKDYGDSGDNKREKEKRGEKKREERIGDWLRREGRHIPNENR